jgi:chitinase
MFDVDHRTPYTYIGDQWVGYDDVQSLTEKVAYMKAGGYGGWMTWNMDLDDFTGTHCGNGLYPLHKAINLALTGEVPTESPTTATTQPAPTTTTTPYTGPPTTGTTQATTTVAGTSFCSGKADGVHVNPDDCGSFYNCGNGNGGLTPCGQGTYFNPDAGACDWPANLSTERKIECGL